LRPSGGGDAVFSAFGLPEPGGAVKYRVAHFEHINGHGEVHHYRLESIPPQPGD